MRKLIFLLFTTIAFAQTKNSSGFATIPASESIAPSAILEARSTTKGFLLPRMTESQRDAIPSPATSLMIYQTDGDAGYYYYNGTSWVSFGSGGSTSGVETVNGESPDGGGNVVVNRQSVIDQDQYYSDTFEFPTEPGGLQSVSLLSLYHEDTGALDGKTMFATVTDALFADGSTQTSNHLTENASGLVRRESNISHIDSDGNIGSSGSTINGTKSELDSFNASTYAEYVDVDGAEYRRTDNLVYPKKQQIVTSRPPVSGNTTRVTYQTPETIEPGIEATITKAAPEVAGDYFEPIIFEVGGTDYTADATGRVVLSAGGGGGGVTEVTGTDGVTIASGTTTPVVGLGNITPDSVAASGTVSGSNLSGTNTGDQTSISGITGTKAQFDTAVTDGNFLYVGDVTQYTDANARTAVVQNSMTASATLSPSVTAVNTALAGKRDAPIFLQLTSDYTGLSGTSAQKIFNVGASGNGRVSLEAKTYRIRGQIIVDGVSAPSGAMTFSLGGTATFTSSFSVNGKKAAETASAPLQAYAINAASVQITTSNSNTTGFFDVEGTVVVTGAGYLQPLIAHSVGVSGGFTIKAKSWFEAELISDNSTTHSGNTD